MKIGIIKEGKTPSDSRVALTPGQCKKLINEGWNIVVQKSESRCYSDIEYADKNVPLVDDVYDCDVLIGVKEVPISQLIADKTYFFFSHTIKEQSYNQPLLKAIIDKNIKLLDYEVLTNDRNARVIAFGKFAGMVGAHNGLWTYGKKTGEYNLPRLKDLKDYAEAKSIYAKLELPNLKVVLTGTGRVANGAAMVLEDMGLKKVSALNYLSKSFEYPVFTQLSSFYYAERKDGVITDFVTDFFNNPTEYKSQFQHFTKVSDIFVNGIFWNNEAPPFFTLDDIKKDNFKIKVIADVTCDIAPVSSVPTTLRPSTIADPVFGFDKNSKKEVAPYLTDTIDMMTIDNLPNELPRDASEAFGEMFIEHVIDELKNPESQLIERATIADKGKLGTHFTYLTDYLAGK
jgi:alanine dehydrogenase